MQVRATSHLNGSLVILSANSQTSTNKSLVSTRSSSFCARCLKRTKTLCKMWIAVVHPIPNWHLIKTSAHQRIHHSQNHPKNQAFPLPIVTRSGATQQLSGPGLFVSSVARLSHLKLGTVKGRTSSKRLETYNGIALQLSGYKVRLVIQSELTTQKVLVQLPTDNLLSTSHQVRPVQIAFRQKSLLDGIRVTRSRLHRLTTITLELCLRCTMLCQNRAPRILLEIMDQTR